jgi:hypothetical protein
MTHYWNPLRFAGLEPSLEGGRVVLERRTGDLRVGRLPGRQEAAALAGFRAELAEAALAALGAPARGSLSPHSLSQVRRLQRRTVGRGAAQADRRGLRDVM